MQVVPEAVGGVGVAWVGVAVKPNRSSRVRLGAVARPPADGACAELTLHVGGEVTRGTGCCRVRTHTQIMMMSAFESKC